MMILFLDILRLLLSFFPFRTQTIKPWHIDDLHNILNTYCFDDILDEYKKIKEDL